MYQITVRYLMSPSSDVCSGKVNSAKPRRIMYHEYVITLQDIPSVYIMGSKGLNLATVTVFFFYMSNNLLSVVSCLNSATHHMFVLGLLCFCTFSGFKTKNLIEVVILVNWFKSVFIHLLSVRGNVPQLSLVNMHIMDTCNI